jgi:prolyl-tRNA synthetase
MRSKSGLMRGREFWMKDLYSFSKNQDEHDVFYERITEAYHRVYDRLGLGDITYKTFASGGSFSKYSHEFQTLSPVGEDTIYIHKEKGVAINQEVYTDEVLADLGVKKEELEEVTAVEVGNIFTLGTRFSEPLELTYTNEEGKLQPVFMGSYGIGPSRLMGLIAEHFADDKGLVWPVNIAPATVYLVQIGTDNDVIDVSQQLYDNLTSLGVTVLWDDRDARPGEKFADADLYGIPYRVVVSQKTIANGEYEVKARSESDAQMLSKEGLVNLLTT